MEAERWRFPKVDTKDLSSQSAAFILDQAEKAFKDFKDRSEKITVRAFAILVVIISIVSTLTGFLVGELNSTHGITFLKSFYIIVIVIGIIIILFLAKLLYPRKVMTFGREPKNTALTSILIRPDKPKSESFDQLSHEKESSERPDMTYLVLMIIQIESLQHKIDHTRDLNRTRIDLFGKIQIAILVTLIASFVSLMIYFILHQ